MPLSLNHFSGWSESGNQQVMTPGCDPSTTLVQRSYPGATINVYVPGTTTPATIYSDSGGTPKPNPFTSHQADGYWDFFCELGACDVNFSGAGIASAFTISVVGYSGKSLAQMQSPWVTDIDGGNHTLSNVGYINMRAPDGHRVEAVPGIITIVPPSGSGPFNVFNTAGTAADWAIDVNGNLSSSTARVISTAGDLTVRNITANGGITAYGNIQTIGPGAFVASDSGGTPKATMDAGGAITAHGAITALGIGFNTDVPYRANGALGVNGTFTTADGKTVTVTGGIITSIV